MNEQQERWRPVAGFPDYEVSDLGRVKRVTPGHGVRVGRVMPARQAALLRRDGRPCRRKTHMLVLGAFRGPQPDGMYPCFIDGDTSNNRLENLKWSDGALAGEEWRSVVGYGAGYYEVSDFGRIRSSCDRPRTWRGRLLSPTQYDGKYPGVVLSVGGAMKSIRVHRVVLEAFVGPRPTGMECRHLDGDTSNNSLSNLAWGTPRQNASDKRRHGTQVEGESQGRSVLTEDCVLAIRKLLLCGDGTQREIATQFGVSNMTVSLINTGRTWTHVPLDEGVRFPVRRKYGLTAPDVLDIRSLLRRTQVPVNDIATLYGVGRHIVSNINAGRSWCGLRDSKHATNANTYPCRAYRQPPQLTEGAAK